MNTTDHFIGVFYLGSDMSNITHYPPWWTSWKVDGVDLDSIDGYLITCSFEDDGRPIAIRVEGLSVGDADPRDSNFTISRIDSVLDSDGNPGMAYLHLVPADGSEPRRHPYDWAQCYPLVVYDLDSVIDLIHINHGNHVPTNFQAEVSVS